MDEGAGPDSSTFARLEQSVLGGPRVLSIAELAARLEAPPERLVALWQAFGLPEDPDAKVFTEYDAAVVGRQLAGSDTGELSPTVAASLVRSVNHLTDRLAVWQVETLVEHLAQRYGLDDVTARILLLDRLADAVPLLEEQLVHAWRHHLVNHAARTASQVATVGHVPDPTRLPLARAVGFADVVSFSARTAGLPAAELADVVQRFESRARDVVSLAGGRTVKTIGDAVFFVADEAAVGARVALDLADAFGPDSPTPVRVGVVWGQVLARFGDVYGPPVNLAARLTSEAEPCTVLTDEATAAELAPDPALTTTPLAERAVAGFGRVRPVRLDRAARTT